MRVPDRKPDIHVFSPREIEIWYEEDILRVDNDTIRRDLRPSLGSHALKEMLSVKDYVHYVASIPGYPNHAAYKAFLDEIIEKEIFHST